MKERADEDSGLVWIDELQAYLSSNPGVRVTFAEEEDEALVDAVLGMLMKAHEEMTRLNEEMKQEVERRAEHIAEIEQIHTWADSFEAATFDHKRTIIAGVVEKVVVANVKEIEVVLKLTARQFLGESSEGTGD